ncbi:XkdX family protein [Ligilactobacillus agilis]|nr:XkdX family protein [Ligilactobacillus agilis]MDM8279624.1 XkdX family protein [Ligilactobacillus agilis]
MFEMFKSYYPLGLFTLEDCRNAVKCGYFDEAGFKEITGQDY